MRSTKGYILRLSSTQRSTCEDLRRLNVQIAAALRNGRISYRASVKPTGSAALVQTLEEGLKQTSAVHQLVCNVVDAHLTKQDFQARSVRLPM
jgi:hypothetical protein